MKRGWHILGRSGLYSRYNVEMEIRLQFSLTPDDLYDLQARVPQSITPLPNPSFEIPLFPFCYGLASDRVDRHFAIGLLPAYSHRRSASIAGAYVTAIYRNYRAPEFDALCLDLSLSLVLFLAQAHPERHAQNFQSESPA